MMHIFAAASTAPLSVSWVWYVVRVSGFTAAALLVLLMLSGIGQVTGLTYRIWEPVKAWTIHKAMALALCGAIFVHGSFLLLDRFVSFSLAQVLVPFISHYSNNVPLFGLHINSVALAGGILAMYGVIIIVLSSLGWIDTKKRSWRWLHYLSYAVMLLVFIHALGVGSDLKHGWLRRLAIIAMGIIALGVVSRLLRAGTLRAPKKI